MQIKELKNEKSVALVEIHFTQAEVDIERNHVVDEMIGQVTVKGFRQGKAPRNLAIEHLDPNRLTDHILSHVLNNAVSEVIKEKKYRLLGRPVLQNLDTQKDKDGWMVNINFPLYPEVKLGDYQKLLAKKDKKSATKNKKIDSSKPEDRLNEIYDTLLVKISLDIPQPVIDEEVGYSVQRLENQAKSLNLSLDSYLKAVNKTLDQVKTEYAKSAEENLKLDLILLEIAKIEKIDSTDEEVKQMALLSQAPESQYSQIKAVLDRRKTLEFLSKIK